MPLFIWMGKGASSPACTSILCDPFSLRLWAMICLPINGIISHTVWFRFYLYLQHITPFNNQVHNKRPVHLSFWSSPSTGHFWLLWHHQMKIFLLIDLVQYVSWAESHNLGPTFSEREQWLWYALPHIPVIWDIDNNLL